MVPDKNGKLIHGNIKWKLRESDKGGVWNLHLGEAEKKVTEKRKKPKKDQSETDKLLAVIVKPKKTGKR
jgi:hypothetical protein